MTLPPPRQPHRQHPPALFRVAPVYPPPAIPPPPALTLPVAIQPTGTIGRSPHPSVPPIQPPVCPTYRLTVPITPQLTAFLKDPVPPALPRHPALPLCPAHASYRWPPSAAPFRQNALAQSLTP